MRSAGWTPDLSGKAARLSVPCNGVEGVFRVAVQLFRVSGKGRAPTYLRATCYGGQASNDHRRQVAMMELVANCDRFNKMKRSSVPMTAFSEHGIIMLASVLKS